MAQIPVHVSSLAINAIRRVHPSCNKFTELQMTQTNRPLLIAAQYAHRKPTISAVHKW